MNIPIYKDYHIRSDERNFMLSIKRRRINKEGIEEESFDDIGFYGSLEGALRAFARREIGGCKATTFLGLQKEYARLNKLIESFAEQVTSGGKKK